MTMFEALAMTPLARLGLALVAPARLSDGSAPTYHVQGEGGGVLCGLPWSEDDGYLTIITKEAYDADLTPRVCADCQKAVVRKMAERLRDSFEPESDPLPADMDDQSLALVNSVESAYFVIRDALTDFDRLRIRDEARAAVEAWLRRLSDLLWISGPHIGTPRKCGNG